MPQRHLQAAPNDTVFVIGGRTDKYVGFVVCSPDPVAASVNEDNGGSVLLVDGGPQPRMKRTPLPRPPMIAPARRLLTSGCSTSLRSNSATLAGAIELGASCNLGAGRPMVDAVSPARCTVWTYLKRVLDDGATPLCILISILPAAVVLLLYFLLRS